MAPNAEKSQLKRGFQNSVPEETDSKKARRSQRLQETVGDIESLKNDQGQLPSPLTHNASTATDDFKDGTATPPSQIEPPVAVAHSSSSPKASQVSSPPNDTQPFSQFVYPPKSLAWEVQDEEGEGVYGYLVPLDSKSGDTLVLRRRNACPVPHPSNLTGTDGKGTVKPDDFMRQEEEYENAKAEQGTPAGGYLIGRHPECDRQIKHPTVSNRHCLIFQESKGGDAVAVLEDLSGNGTFVNEAIVGRNKRRELQDGDEVSILQEARYIFRQPRFRSTKGFYQQFKIQEQLGKGHFATVYLCIEKDSGKRFAVKKFEKRSGPGERSRVEGLQQEIGVLMGVSHPSLLCLKDTFDEKDGVYLVLELAPEGELFNWIVMKQKLTEEETRKIFVQLFQALKYLHERNIVHRDIKPENILLVDKELSVKLADFGLAKIIGEESFTTTLCGTPSYVAPEILASSNHRRYTRAVDVWSLGVVLYICLCGFPPFSDELYTSENPYTLAQQIKMGRFDYPSPYWDSVGDPALDLIDRMLTVDVEDRISIEECLQHPWTTNQDINLNDSTDGLTAGIGNLDFSKRKLQRERTMLSAINDVKVSRVIPIEDDMPPLKIYEKNQNTQMSQRQAQLPENQTAKKPQNKGNHDPKAAKEVTPAANRNPDEFMEMGGKGDAQLFGNDSGSRYAP